MADLSWYGEAVFADMATRDHVRGLIEDYMEATQGTMPFGGEQNYAPGIEAVTQIHLDVYDGPGLRWCYRIPEALGVDAANILAQVDVTALGYNSGTSPIIP